MHPDIAFCYSTMASLLGEKDPSEALSLLERCQGIPETLLGANHTAIIYTCNQTGALLRRMGRLHESLECFQHAINILTVLGSERTAGLDAETYANMSATAHLVGDTDTADHMHKNALQALKESPICRDQRVVSVYDTIGEEMLQKRDF